MLITSPNHPFNLLRTLAVLALVLAGFASQAQTPVPVAPTGGIWDAGQGFDFGLKKKKEIATRQSLSGIACAPNAAQQMVCLVVFDEGAEARFATVGASQWVPKKADRVTLPGIRGELDAEEVSGTLLPVVGQGLMGLLLEVGPALLPMLDVLPDAFPGMSSVITRLRGWRAHPVRPRAHISAKEMQLLTLLAGGQSNKAIALALDISENTVKFHLKQIFRKLEVENRSAAISTALREGLLDPRA